MFKPFACILACTPLLIPLNGRAQTSMTHEPDGVVVRSDADVLRVIVCSPEVIHVVASPPASNPALTQPPWIEKPCGSSEFSMKQDEHEAVIRAHLANAQLESPGNLPDATGSWREFRKKRLRVRRPGPRLASRLSPSPTGLARPARFPRISHVLVLSVRP